VSGSYKKRAERANPACVVFLIDQSFSMTEGLAGSNDPASSKIRTLSLAVNRFIQDLIGMCEKGEDEPFDYFYVGVIAYTTDRSSPPNVLVGPVLQGQNGTLAGRDLVTIRELFRDPQAIEDRVRKVPDGAGGVIDLPVKFPIWYCEPDPMSMGGTPMSYALDYARGIAEAWCNSRPGSFPPVIIHVTDGEPTDGDPEPYAEALKALATEDGNVLLFNCHLSTSPASPVVFPTSEGMLPDEYAKLLYRMSSEVPDTSEVRAQLETRGVSFPKGARGMVFNADATAMITLITVGTSAGGSAAVAPSGPEYR
jgi:hypothetical protein